MTRAAGSSASPTAGSDGASPGALIRVVHEDEALLVVDKPAGLVVHPSKDGPLSSLIGRVRLYLGHGEGRLVNRLDRETSGLVLVAKHDVAARELGRLFAAGAVEKRYQAVVHGTVAGVHTIDAPLGRDVGSPIAIRDTVRDDGAEARTDVTGLRLFARDGTAFSVVDLAHAGHPIVGDKLYGPDPLIYLRFVESRMTAEDARAMILEYQALHAASLAFTWAGRDWQFEVPAGPELRSFAGLD
jgi:23S rRNA pseudouridine1911/1915/1917 synthase